VTPASPAAAHSASRPCRKRRSGSAERGELGLQDAVATEEVERAVARHLEEPAASVVRDPSKGPRGQCAQQRLLHRLLGQVQSVGAEAAGEHCNHPSGAVPEQVLD
jgi:hypothetical protein